MPPDTVIRAAEKASPPGACRSRLIGHGGHVPRHSPPTALTLIQAVDVEGAALGDENTVLRTLPIAGNECRDES